jgi:hypothetical protein
MGYCCGGKSRCALPQSKLARTNTARFPAELPGPVSVTRPTLSQDWSTRDT